MVRNLGTAYIRQMEKQIPLSLKGNDTGPDGAADPSAPTDVPGIADELRDKPVIGYLAVICGVMAIFFWGIVFVPMGLAFSVAALIAGQGLWGFSGLVLSVIGLLTSPTLLTLIGLGAIASFLGLG